MEKFIPPGAKVKLEWDVAEKPSLPAFEGEVDASFPVDGSIGNGATTSAIARNSRGVVIPPHIRGTTEYVPSFWMLA